MLFINFFKLALRERLDFLDLFLIFLDIVLKLFINFFKLALRERLDFLEPLDFLERFDLRLFAPSISVILLYTLSVSPIGVLFRFNDSSPNSSIGTASVELFFFLLQPILVTLQLGDVSQDFLVRPTHSSYANRFLPLVDLYLRVRVDLLAFLALDFFGVIHLLVFLLLDLFDFLHFLAPSSRISDFIYYIIIKKQFKNKNLYFYVFIFLYFLPLVPDYNLRFFLTCNMG
jgi:hypothetical protein